jgi:hypothetical protein
MNFATAVQCLVDAGVDFVIIGGWSAILHGTAHTTNDLDICFSRPQDLQILPELEALAEALEDPE